MIVIKFALMALLFLLELSALAAFGYWGFHTRNGMLTKIVLGIGIPLLVAVFWGLFIAPKATFAVNIPMRIVLQLVVYGLATIALYAAGKSTLAIIFIIITIITLIFSYSLGV